jgi:hypothetical protein
MLTLGKLRPGEYKELTDDEVKLMQTPAPELKAIKNTRARVRKKPYQRTKRNK